MGLKDTSRFKKELVNKQFDYHFHLTGRRWQYFVAFLLLNGLFLNAWDKFSKRDSLGSAVFCSGMILSAMALMRLISRARVRIQMNGGALNALVGRKLIDVPDKETLNLGGITFWLYTVMIAMSAGWLYMLSRLNVWIFSVLLFVFLVNLYFIKWRSVVYRPEDAAKTEETKA